MGRRLRVAVWNFGVCEDCRRQALAATDPLLAMPAVVEVVHVLEGSGGGRRECADVALVMGAVDDGADAERLDRIRRGARRVIAAGACAVRTCPIAATAVTGCPPSADQVAAAVAVEVVALAGPVAGVGEAVGPPIGRFAAEPGGRRSGRTAAA